MKTRPRNNDVESSQAIEDELRNVETSQATWIAKLAELTDRRNAAVDAGDAKTAEELDPQIVLATLKVRDGERRSGGLQDRLEKARVEGEVAGKRAFVAAVRALAVDAADKVRRRAEVVNELKQLNAYIAGLSIVIRETNTVARELNEQKIADPAGSIGIPMMQTSEAEVAAAQMAKQLRQEAASAA